MLENKLLLDFSATDANFSMRNKGLLKHNTSEVNQQRELWDIEYKTGNTIPSSGRIQPSRSLIQILKNLPFIPTNILDIGAGNGRNAIYFASQGVFVHAIDFSDAAIEIFSKKIKRMAGLKEKIELINHDIREGMPFKNNQFDAVLDSYCLCHFIDRKEEASAILEVKRILKPGGILMKIHTDIEDSYYRDHMLKKDKDNFISFNNANLLYKRHYSPSSYLMSLGEHYKHIQTIRGMYKDVVQGKDYIRSIFAMMLVKV